MTKRSTERVLGYKITVEICPGVWDSQTAQFPGVALRIYLEQKGKYPNANVAIEEKKETTTYRSVSLEELKRLANVSD